MKKIKLKLNNETKNAVPFILVFLSFWLIPTKFFHMYVILISIILLIFAIKQKFYLTQNTKWVLIFIVYLVFTATVRFFVLMESDFRDLYEIGRFIPVLLILGFYKKWDGFKFEYLLISLIIFLGINTTVTYLQNIQSYSHPIVTLVRDLYNSTNHFDNSLLLANRALGLSSGPGQHGTMMAMCFIFGLVSFYYKKEKRVLSLATIIMSLYCLISSQSRTAFISVLLVLALFVLWELLRGKTIKKIKILLALSIVYITTFLTGINEWIIQKRYLYRIFTQGTETSSYYARENKWSGMLAEMGEQPFLMVTGYGKHFFGASSGTMDNEYFFIFSVYGLIIAFIFLFILLRFIFSSMVNWKNVSKNIYKTLLFYSVIIGLPIAWASSYWLDPRIMYTISALIAIYNKKKNFI